MTALSCMHICYRYCWTNLCHSVDWSSTMVTRRVITLTSNNKGFYFNMSTNMMVLYCTCRKGHCWRLTSICEGCHIHWCSMSSHQTLPQDVRGKDRQKPVVEPCDRLDQWKGNPEQSVLRSECDTQQDRNSWRRKWMAILLTQGYGMAVHSTGEHKLRQHQSTCRVVLVRFFVACVLAVKNNTTVRDLWHCEIYV